MANKFRSFFPLIIPSFILAACSALISAPQDAGQTNMEGSIVKQTTPRPTVDVADYDIVTLLPRDAIPAIDNPVFYEVAEANQEYADTEQVIGVVFEGEAKAYSTGLLSSHEIVNDTVGGRKIAVTW
ncbi:MAG: DUF3179 domain-containing protein [Chloroflexi bacterium]|nr:DUF3179 domain-containing protein [Chloroflexota bacterium]